MSSIRATNPKIIRVAEIFSKKYPDIILAEVLEAAYENRDKKAAVFLMTLPTLYNSAKKIFHIKNSDESPVYKKYLLAVAQAQINLLYEGSEYEQIKQLIEINFIQSRHKDVFQTIDQLVSIDLAKKEGKKIFIGDIDSELTSNKNGFILTAIQTEDIKNLFIEAALF